MKKVHVMMEAPSHHYSEQAITTLTFIDLRPDASEVAVCMRNVSAQPITITAITTIGSVSTANIIPLMLAPKIKTFEENPKRGN